MTFRNIRYKVNFIFCSIGRAGITGTKPQAAPYVGGCSSLLSQPVTRSVFIGSGQSQSRHWSLRFPFPSKGSAKTKGAPQLGQVGRSWPIKRFCRHLLRCQQSFLGVCAAHCGTWPAPAPQRIFKFSADSLPRFETTSKLTFAPSAKVV
jgi:hypothetical protein